MNTLEDQFPPLIGLYERGDAWEELAEKVSAIYYMIKKGRIGEAGIQMPALAHGVVYIPVSRVSGLHRELGG
jgi:hypothetical protein